MNIKEIKSEKLYKEYLLVIPFTEVDKEVDNKIQKLIPTISIPGFRKGKAPVSIVKKKYEDNVLNEVLQSIISTKTNQFINKEKLNLFREPKINLKKFEKNKPLEINIQIDLQPEIKIKSFKDFKLNKYEISLSNQESENLYKEFLNSQKSFKKIVNNRLIKNTDRIFINLNTSSDKIPDYLKSQKNLPVDMNLDQQLLPELNNKIIKSKLKEGDKKIVTFNLSKMLNNSELKKIDFEIEILSIEEKIKFEINNDYLKNNGFKNESDLKKLIIQNSNNQYNQALAQIEKKELMDLLDRNYSFDLPTRILDEDFKEIWQRLENAKKNDKLDDDDKALNEKDLKKRYKKISERRVKLGVLMQYIAKEKNISVSEDELNKGIMDYATRYPGQEKQIIEYLQKNPSYVESIRAPLLEQKIINSIISESTIKNKKLDKKQYKKLEEETFDIKREL